MHSAQQRVSFKTGAGTLLTSIGLTGGRSRHQTLTQPGRRLIKALFYTGWESRGWGVGGGVFHGAGAMPEPDTREHTIEEVIDEQATQIRYKQAYEAYNLLSKYSSTINAQVASSSAGLLGYANSPLGKHVKVNESSLWGETMVRKTGTVLDAAPDFFPCVETYRSSATRRTRCQSPEKCPCLTTSCATRCTRQSVSRRVT